MWPCCPPKTLLLAFELQPFASLGHSPSVVGVQHCSTDQTDKMLKARQAAQSLSFLLFRDIFLLDVGSPAHWYTTHTVCHFASLTWTSIHHHIPYHLKKLRFQPARKNKRYLTNTARNVQPPIRLIKQKTIHNKPTPPPLFPSPGNWKSVSALDREPVPMSRSRFRLPKKHTCSIMWAIPCSSGSWQSSAKLWR